MITPPPEQDFSEWIEEFFKTFDIPHINVDFSYDGDRPTYYTEKLSNYLLTLFEQMASSGFIVAQRRSLDKDLLDTIQAVVPSIKWVGKSGESIEVVPVG